MGGWSLAHRTSRCSKLCGAHLGSEPPVPSWAGLPERMTGASNEQNGAVLPVAGHNALIPGLEDNLAVSAGQDNRVGNPYRL